MRLPSSEGTAYCVAYLLESLFIIIGNLLVIVVFTSSRQLRKRRHYFLVNLALSDFLVGVVSVPIAVYRLAMDFDLWPFTSRIGVVFAMFFAQRLSCFSSLLNLAAISLERMYAILWPMKHRSLTSRTYRALTALAWTMSACLAALGAYHKAYSLWNPIIHLFFLLIVSGILLTICFSYISIWMKFKFGERPFNNAGVAHERKLTVSLLIVTVVSLITGLPYSVLFVAFPERPSGLSVKHFAHLANSFSLLFLINSLVNPVVYIFRMPPFRQAVSRLLHRQRAIHNQTNGNPTEQKVTIREESQGRVESL